MPTEVRSRGSNYRFDNKIIVNGVQTYYVKGGRSLTWQDSRSGSDLPNWRQIIKGGGNATTFFSAYETVRTPVPIVGTCHLKGPKNGTSKDQWFWTFMDDFGTYGAEDPAFLSSTKTDLYAREQFLKRYRSRRTAFQSGVFLGELNQTVQMIRSPAQALRNHITQYRERAKKRVRGLKGKKFRETAASSWLEAQFGWAPLVSDIQDALKLADASPTRYRENITGQSNTSYSSAPTKTSAPPAGGVSYPWIEYSVGRVNKVGVKYKGAVDAVRVPPPSFAEQLGLSWSNVLPTAWELVPYSFLIDYFSNIGQVIEGISTGTIRLAWGCRTSKMECETHLVVGPDNKTMSAHFGSNYEWSAFVNGSGKVSHRKILGRYSIEDVSVGLADTMFEVPAARSKKWLNIAALAVMRTADQQSYSRYVR